MILNPSANSTFLATLNREKVTHTPIWLMRQAGRYLPEYRKIRAEAGSFLNLCKNPELAAQVTLQPLARFPLDAAILFSDILVVPEAMGLNLYFSDNEGPKFSNPITSTLDIDSLKTIDPTEDLRYVMQTILNVKQQLPANFPLIGFSGSPWTLACYMIEGGSSKNYEKIKTWVYQHPQALHSLLEKLSIAVADYLHQQIKSGVDTIMLFDSWGGVLSTDKFIQFSHFYLNQVLQKLQQRGHTTPSIVFTKGGGAWLTHLQQLPCSALGIDWTIGLNIARQRTSKVLQGNLDPVILSVGDKSSIQEAVDKIIQDYQNANHGQLDGHIFNLGHGILPSAKPDNVAFLVDYIHERTRR